jgi:hypothetical protein
MRHHRHVELIETNAETIDVQTSREELTILANALSEVLGGARPIEKWEFQTLIGVSRDKAKALRESLSRLLRG